MLWVPATATTQGSVSFYFNGVQVGNTITWNQYVPGQAAPDNPFAVMDADDMVPILGAGPGTTATFSNLQVWQASAASDIGTGAAAAAAVQPCTGGETTTPAVTPIATPGTAAPATTGATAATTLATTAGSPMQPQSSLATITGASDPASATIVPGQGSLTDSNGNVWTITASGSITENGAFTTGGGGTAALSIVNGTVYGQDNGQDGNTANSGGWFTLSGNGQSWAVSSPPPATTAATGKAAPVTATPAKAVSSAPAAAAPGNPAPSAATTVAPAAPLPPVSTAPIALGLAAQFSCSTATPNSAASAGGFSTVNGQILSPSGQPWIAQGVNVPDFDMQTAQSSLLSLLPGTNFIRLNIYNYAAPSTYQSFINWATSQGIVVEIDDHTSFPSNAFTGSQLTAETQFYSAMAAAYINNPYVWYETQNEPQGGDITAENVAVYNAVRATGNNNPVGFQPLGGGNPGFLSSMDASAYTSMSNVYMAGHFYAWIDGYSTDPATVSAALGNEISAAQSLQSADGPMPVIIDEYGDNVNNTAAGGTQVVTAVLASGYGSAAWSFDNPGGGTEDQLTNNEQSLTAFGQQLAAAEPSTGPGCNISPVATLVPSTATVTAPSSGTGTPLAPQNSLTVIPAPAGMN
jgi:Cellulase (glycosyl hydrolase family 5)